MICCLLVSVTCASKHAGLIFGLLPVTVHIKTVMEPSLHVFARIVQNVLLLRVGFTWLCGLQDNWKQHLPTMLSQGSLD